VTGRARSLPLRDLLAECRRLRDHLVSTGVATAEGLTPCEPGGRDNPDTGPRGVMIWHGLLHQRIGADRATREFTKATDGRSAADATVMAALAARPEGVTLVTPLTDGRRQVGVHPKSPEALAWIAVQDRWMGELVAKRAIIAESQTAQDRHLTTRIDREILHTLHLFAWAVTHEGPRLPFAWDDEPEIPDAIRDMDPMDIHRIAQAHVRVNGRRLQAVSALITSDSTPGSKPPAWSVFVAASASELGVQPSVMMRDWSLGELLASVRLAGQAKREAHEAAKAKVKRQPVGSGAF